MVYNVVCQCNKKGLTLSQVQGHFQSLKHVIVLDTLSAQALQALITSGHLPMSYGEVKFLLKTFSLMYSHASQYALSGTKKAKDGNEKLCFSNECNVKQSKGKCSPFLSEGK